MSRKPLRSLRRQAPMSRREFLVGSGATAVLMALPSLMAQAATEPQPRVVALDGQPVTPHEPTNRTVVLGPAMRADLILDMTGDPGTRFTITDTFYQRQEYELIDVVYGPESLRSGALDSPIALSDNTLPEPLMAGISRHQIRFNGGMMGQMMMRGRNNMMAMMREGNKNS